MKRAISAKEFMNIKIERYELSKAFAAAFGSPERCGVWFIYGNSGGGKTRFALQLAKEMAAFGKVIYDSLEEGIGGTMQKAFRDLNMAETGHKVLLVHETITALEERLKRQRSGDIVIIDSLQYSRLTYPKYQKFKEKYAGNKLIIFTSHAEGKHPRGNCANSVLYDATMKIWIEGYRAFSRGRYFGAEQHFTIWEEGAAGYWGTI
jgi:DNA replication protein DnaC